jgi:HAD superfamily hydrolase (TIGR01549 family)
LGQRIIRGVLFDVDGTLYAQLPLRLLMGLELALMPLRVGPHRARQILALLSAYRQAHETVRAGAVSQGAPADRQLTMAAESVGFSSRQAAAVVAEWMERRPLKYLRLCRRRGVVTLVDALRSSGVRVGALSDYPAKAKLRALGIERSFDPVVWTGSEQVGALKPDPKGFLEAARLWDLPPGEILYVGDRPDVDLEGARRAGMPCVIVGRRSPSTETTLGGPAWRPACLRLRDTLFCGR